MNDCTRYKTMITLPANGEVGIMRFFIAYLIVICPTTMIVAFISPSFGDWFKVLALITIFFFTTRSKKNNGENGVKYSFHNSKLMKF